MKKNKYYISYGYTFYGVFNVDAMVLEMEWEIDSESSIADTVGLLKESVPKIKDYNVVLLSWKKLKP